MKLHNLLKYTALTGSLLFSASAVAIPELAVGIDDTSTGAAGSLELITYDQSVDDNIPVAGIVQDSYSTSNLEVSTALGSNVGNPLSLHLDGSLTTFAIPGTQYDGSGEATIAVTGTDFVGDYFNLIFNIGGSAQGSVYSEAWIDFGNTAFTKGTMISSYTGTDLSGAFSFNSDQLDLVSNAVDPYSISIFTTITHTVAGTSSFNSEVNVPEPSIVALFGLGLLGLGVASRRRMKS